MGYQLDLEALRGGNLDRIPRVQRGPVWEPEGMCVARVACGDRAKLLPACMHWLECSSACMRADDSAIVGLEEAVRVLVVPATNTAYVHVDGAMTSKVNSPFFRFD